MSNTDADSDAKAFKLLFHSMPIASMLIESASSRVLDVNQAFQRMFGWSTKVIVGQLSSEFPLWVSQSQRQQLLERLLQQGYVDQSEGLLHCRDGSLKTCLISIANIDVSGTPCRLAMAHDISEQRSSAQALKQSEERLNLALDAAQMGIWDWDIRNNLLQASAHAAQLNGLPNQPWQGPINDFMRHTLPADRLALSQAYIAICRGPRQRHRLAYRLERNNAPPRWLEITAVLHRNSQGKALRMVGTLLDITERRRNEQALIASEKKFSDLFQGSPIPCALINSQNDVIIEVNSSFIDTFGYQPEAIIGQTISEIGFWRNATQRFEIMNALSESKPLSNREIELCDQHGRTLICEISSALFTINRQQCAMFSFQDITARKQAEAALRASEQKFALAFRASPDSISISERDSGRHLEINEGFSRMTGFSAAEVIGKTARELDIWSDYSQRASLLDELDRQGRVHQREMRVRGKYGQELMVSVSIEPLEIDQTACMLISARDITEQKLIEARVKHQAYHDALTDLPNRMLLTDRLIQHIALCRRQQLKSALLFFDLDHFKHINDSLGHSCGDAVLQEVTRRLLAQVRQEDTVARLGGDEFVVLLNGLDTPCAQQAMQIASKLLDSLAEPMQVEGHSLQLSTSIGIALIPEHGDSPDDLLKRADIALYRVKENGRNGIAFFEHAMQEAARERLAVESELRRALARSEFVLHYQPQFDARQQRIIGAEALIRWMHPQRGLISPLSFIGILEETGMIIEAGCWVVEQACLMVSRLLEHGLVEAEHFSLCINISPRQFHQPGFVEQISNALTRQQIPAACIKLEITENVVIQNLADTIAKMHRLRELGVCLAVDDFGTGYSSLSYLKRLPISLLKIDQSFIRECTLDQNDGEIVRAIIAMAHSLHLELIAEGVETREQLQFLQQLSCHRFQGYLFSPPLAEAKFIAMLAQGMTPMPA